MNNNHFGLLLTVLFSFNVAAADFQYLLPLKTETSAESHATAYVLQLPPVVYEKAKDPMLRDVRVKNSQGDDVPMRLTLSQDDIKQSLSEVTLPIFSLNHTVSTPLRSKQVSTSWQGDVRQFSVETSESVQNFISSQEQIFQDRFLLDATLLNQLNVAALELTWQFETPGNRVFYVEVKGSHDLSHWQTIISRQKLIELNTGQRLVLENSVPLYGKTYSYYQLRFLDAPVPQVTAVKALMKSHALDRPLLTLDVPEFEILDPEINGHAITWETGGFYPIETVEFDFDYKNLMADVQLYSRATNKSNWQRVSSGQLYQVGSGDMAMEKNILSIQSNYHRYWKLTTQSSISSQWVNGVSMAWRPHQLQFLAQGNGPYSLYFGSNDLKSSPSNRWYQQLNKQLAKDFFSDQITPGALTKLSPKPKVIPEPESPISRYVFWALLVLVLSALFYMASRLMKEVGDE